MYDDSVMQKGRSAYMQTQFTTVGQGELLVMLYDGALKFLKQAREKMLQKDYAAKGTLISKALDVINELDGSINQEKGGELAKNLHKLYIFCSTRLLRANLNNSPTQIDEVMKILSGLRSAYAEIVTKPEALAAAEQIANKQTPLSSSIGRGAPMPPAPSVPLAPTGFGRAQARAAYGTASKLGAC